MLKRILIPILLVFPTFIHAQQFKGIVKNKSTNQPLENVVIIIKSKSLGYRYSFTNSKGEFSIPIDKYSDSLFLEAKLLGFKNYKKLILLKKGKIFTFYLEERKEELEEIIIESKRKIKINKDTISYSLPSFIDNTEATVEDVLKKLPGVNINDDGTITIAGKEIEKILIEGDDLTSNNYTILSKNLDANLLKSVQILRNYDDNPVKKQFRNSEKIALNLLIKDHKKNVLFGFFSSGLATKNNYNLKTNLGLLNKQFKALNLTNTNTIGEKLIKKNTLFTYNNHFDIDENEKKQINTEAKAIVNNTIPYFQNNETTLNNSKMSSLTFLKKINRNLKVRFLGGIYKDKVDFTNERNTIFISNQNITKIKEATNSLNNDDNYNVNLELSYFKNNAYITYLTESYQFNRIDNEQILFNTNPNEFILNTNLNSNSHHLKLTHKIGEKILFRNYLYYQKNNGQESYKSNLGYFDKKEQQNLLQRIDKKQKNFGWKSEFLRKGAVNGFSLKTILDEDNSNFKNKISAKNKKLNEFSNTISTSSFKTRLNYFILKKNRKKYLFQVDSQIISFNNQVNKTESFNLFGYLITYNIFSNKLGNFSLTYNLKPRLLNAENFYKGSILRNYRTLNNYNSNIESTNNQNFNFNHNYQLFNHGFISFSTLSYTIISKAVLVNSIFTDGYVENTFNFTNRKSDLFYFQNQTSKYFSDIKTSLKIDNSFTRLTSFYKLNNFLSKNINYGFSSKLSGTTYFDSKVNFEFLFTYDSSWNTIRDTIAQNENFLSRVKINYKINKNLTLVTNINNYKLNSDFFNLTHVNLIYKPRKGRFDYKLIAHNIFNTDKIKSYQLTEFTRIDNRISIIPNYYMLVVNFRF